MVTATQKVESITATGYNAEDAAKYTQEILSTVAVQFNAEDAAFIIRKV
ncbi:MAG: hypothetical protein QTN59_04625 [Candidatus Electrothrix communis]|nr:hypothetical protein [Desulfobulbus sp. US4]WLE98119.1 MAG: hypothetical protein QTN59_04625 [Candidatus Electrothrix communis]